MAKLLYNIETVFGDYLSNIDFYNIPEYQRGYKWTNQQINQLLDDINDFETGGNDEFFYCLQNITLVYNDEKNVFNVVDGQQRLTTITLLLAYLNEEDKVKGKLNYAVREPSNFFIQKIISNESEIRNQILRSVDFNDFISKSNHDFDYQDIYFMFSALRTMDIWFQDKVENQKLFSLDSFKLKLLRNVKIIINRIVGVAEQELFMNLNAGKVQLDGSDLVRAILITRVAKQEMEEFDSKEIKDVVRLNERRIRIGWELDELNAWWSKDSVSEYFSAFTNIRTGEKETIKFDQVKHPINLLYKIWVESIGFSEIKLNLFETKNTIAIDLYTSIVLLHRTLKDWYEDREIYHYLGFLFTQSNIKFTKVWGKWNEKKITREKFVLFLIEELQEFVFGKEPESEDEEKGLQFWLSKIKDYNSVNPTNWYETSHLERILLTLDVIEHSKEKENGMPIPFLKPRYFDNYKEDKEHIYPGTPSQFKEFKKQNASVIGIKKYIKELNTGADTIKKIKWDCSETEWDEASEEEKSKKLILLKEQIHQKRPINSIGNLVLLHMSINRGFGNDYYTDKRISVINNTENGEYVRHHTLKVFVKQTENNDISDWTMQDITNNADKIHDTLYSFFNFRNQEEVNNE